MIRLPSVLTIAGSDCSGGAGIQADLKTITALGLYGSSVITAVTAQNTMGVEGIEPIRPGLIASQMDAVFTDIFPDAVKIGMIGTAGAVRVIADRLRVYAPRHVILDPVMISTSGQRLMSERSVYSLIHELIPCCTLLTPNLMEAAFLLNKTGSPLSEAFLSSKKGMEQAAALLSRIFHLSVLLKGGHREGSPDDLLCHDGILTWFPGKRQSTANTHGTGCTLSSAAACGLAQGLSMDKSILLAKEYLTAALAAGLDLGRGNGPLCHNWNIITP